MGLGLAVPSGTQAFIIQKNVFVVERSRIPVFQPPGSSWLTKSFYARRFSARPMKWPMLAGPQAITRHEQHEEVQPALCWRNAIPNDLVQNGLPSPSSRSSSSCVASNALKVFRLIESQKQRCLPRWRRGWRTAAHRPRIPATPSIVERVSGQLWKALPGNSRKRKDRRPHRSLREEPSLLPDPVVVSGKNAQRTRAIGPESNRVVGADAHQASISN